MTRIPHAAIAGALAALTAGLPAMAGPPHCPPGHARKGWCGQGDAAADAYRQGYRDGRRDERRYSRGDRLPGDAYTVIEDHRYGPAPRGHADVRVDERIFLTALGTGLIVEALR